MNDLSLSPLPPFIFNDNNELTTQLKNLNIMPTRSASGTPTLPIPLPTPSPPPFVTSPNNSYSSNESDDLDSPPCVPSKDNFNPMATISTMPTMLLSTNSDVGSTEEDERQFGTTGGIASSTSNPILPDWRLSILAQKEYSGEFDLSFLYCQR